MIDQLPIRNHHVSSCIIMYHHVSSLWIIINHQLGDAFNYFFSFFTPDPWGNDPIWYVSNGLKPPISQWLINYQELIIGDHHVSSSLCIKMYQCIYHLSPYIVIDGDSAGVLSQQQYNIIWFNVIIWYGFLWCGITQYGILWYSYVFISCSAFCFYMHIKILYNINYATRRLQHDLLVLVKTFSQRFSSEPNAQQGGTEQIVIHGVISPLWMAENDWVTGVITPYV